MPTFLPNFYDFTSTFFLRASFSFFSTGKKILFTGSNVLYQLLLSISRGKTWFFFHYLNAVSRVDFLVKKITGKFQFTWVLIGVISDFFTAIVFSRPFFQIFPFFVACMILICTEKKYCTKYRSIQPEQPPPPEIKNTP